MEIQEEKKIPVNPWIIVGTVVAVIAMVFTGLYLHGDVKLTF